MRRVPLIASVALAGVLLAAFAASRGRGQSAAAVPRAEATAPAKRGATPALSVEVVVLDPRAVEITVPATGTLRARESVELVSELSRRLVRVRADEGTRVKKGEVLFELDVADVRAELERLDVQIALARTTAERQHKLLAEGLSTEAERDAAQGRLDELLASRGVLGVTLSKASIRAPFAGTVGLRHVSEGAWVSPSTVLATLHDTSSLKLDFTLPERYAGQVQQGQRFRFTVEGVGGSLSGTIQAFEPALDETSRSVVVRGVVDNTDARLLPGTFARVELPLSSEQALVVPAIAVIPGADGQRVFVERDGVARAVPVETGVRSGDGVQILRGLAAGDRVIVSNLPRLRDGQPVRVETRAKP
ncbi:MAG TPA: efflux RND transporter periplasmic adaptor subunit [Polyangiaceae bacterium]|nr:efflux RND transporter periplasmic adaptor subunit [Polyangiaceae bacterium]